MRRWLTALLLLLLVGPSLLAADTEEKEKEEATSGNDALPYTIAVLSTAVVMIVIVKPSRKM